MNAGYLSMIGDLVSAELDRRADCHFGDHDFGNGATCGYCGYFNASLLAGADIEAWGVRGGMRFAGGPFATTDGYTGLTAYREISIAVPIRSGAALRLSRRLGTSERIRRKERVREVETALMIVATPDAPALWWVNESGGGDVRLTFAQLAQQCRRAASFFNSQGVRRGDRVLVMV